MKAERRVEEDEIEIRHKLLETQEIGINRLNMILQSQQRDVLFQHLETTRIHLNRRDVREILGKRHRIPSNTRSRITHFGEAWNILTEALRDGIRIFINCDTEKSNLVHFDLAANGWIDFSKVMVPFPLLLAGRLLRHPPTAFTTIDT